MNMITIDTGETCKKVEYKPYELCKEDDPILKSRAIPFDFSGDLDAREIAGRLIETAKKYKGYGLAAPQCGMSIRAVVIGAENDYTAFFNPKIIGSTEESIHMEEGCLSFPFLVLSITRPTSVKIEYQDETGEHKEMIFEGISARVIQHEIDHLNGITFDTLAKPLALKSGLKKRDKYMKRFAQNLVAQRKFAELAK